MAVGSRGDSSSGAYPRYKGLLKAVEGLGFHDHLCLIYETPEEQFAAVVPFVRVGLERRERCVYVADENTSGEVLERMEKGGVDIKAALAKGALSVISKKEAYLKQGYFDPDWMIGFLKEAADSAKADGYTGLRVTGEMTWMLGGDPGSERLIEYESKLNYFFPENDVLAICQYNIGRFSPEIIMDVIRTHPLVIYRGQVCKNFYYTSPEEMLLPNQGYLEVSRLLYNILERERLETLNNQSEDAIGRMEQETGEIERIGRTGSWELDAESGRAAWSAGACRILGLDPGMPPERFEEHLGVYAPGSAKELAEAVKKSLETGQPYELDLELAGSGRWVISRGAVKRATGGRVTSLRGIVIDITGRKRVESSTVDFSSGLLPICAYCKKIRNDKGSWEGFEKFLHERSGAEFTHCICPDCAEKFAKKDIGMA
jgi:PAS domain-containing protein